MLIPYSTDATIDHPPIATISMIVINILVFAAAVALSETFEPFLLVYSEINPVQWLTSVFMHTGYGHIIGNMMFLAIFGIIVEGKVGWYKFLAIYIICGVSAAMLIQLAMYFTGAVGTSLGASCAIFALIGVALVWAPENVVFFKLILILIVKVIYYSFEVSILLAAFGFIVWNFLIASFSGFEMSSATAHLIGLLPGLLMGLAFVMFRWVDCAGLDLVSIMKGERGVKPGPTEAEIEAEEQSRMEAQRKSREQTEHGLQMVNQYAHNGNFEMAVKRLAMLKQDNPDLITPEFASNKLIKYYLASEEEKSKAIPLMEEYLSNYSSRRLSMTLSLARLYVVIDHRPRKGLNLLRTVQQEKLSPTQREFFQKLVLQAKKMIADGILEIDDA